MLKDVKIIKGGGFLNNKKLQIILAIIKFLNYLKVLFIIALLCLLFIYLSSTQFINENYIIIISIIFIILLNVIKVIEENLSCKMFN